MFTNSYGFSCKFLIIKNFNHWKFIISIGMLDLRCDMSFWSRKNKRPHCVSHFGRKRSQLFYERAQFRVFWIFLGFFFIVPHDKPFHRNAQHARHAAGIIGGRNRAALLTTCNGAFLLTWNVTNFPCKSCNCLPKNMETSPFQPCFYPLAYKNASEIVFLFSVSIPCYFTNFFCSKETKLIILEY